MASGAERLKEFVVGLGFEIDEQQFRNFGKVLEKVAENIAEIGAATAIVAAVIDKNVTVIAARFEKLYYASSRTGASVKNLQGLEYGAQQIGFQAGQATSQIEGMTSALRQNPGLAALFGTGDGKDPTKQFTGIIDKLKAMDTGPFGHAIAARYAAMLGISEPDFVMYEKGNEKLKALMAERDSQFRAAGIDPDKVAQRSVDFQNDLRKLSATIDIIETLILERFMPGIDKLINGIARIVGVVGRADKATGGGSTYAIGAAGVLGSLGLVKAIPTILRGILGTLGIGSGVAAGAAEGGAAAAVGGVAWPVVIGAAVAALVAYGGYELYKHMDTPAGGGAGDGAVNRNNPGNLRSWGNAATSGGFAVFSTALDGLSAMAGQLRRYGARHIDTLDGIINTYAPKSDHNDTAAYIKDVAKRTGFSSGQHLNLNDSGTLQTLMAAMIQHEQGRNPYSAGTIQSAIAQRLGRDGVGGGGGGTTLNSETTIHVKVDKDPRSNGQAIGDEQARVNSDLLRNMRPKVN